MKMPLILLGRKDKPILQGIDNITTERVIVLKSSLAHRILKKHRSDILVHFVESNPAGIKAVASGQADIFFQNFFNIEYHLRKLNIQNTKVLASTPFTYDVHFAVPSSMTPLLGLIDKVIKHTTPLEKRLIFDKWVNIEVEEKIDYSLLITTSIIAIAIILLIIALFTYWNRRLAIEVNNRTAELRDLARHMDNVREEEKAKLAREIHDELGHTLTSLLIGIRRICSLTTNRECIKKAEELKELALSASKTSKQIMTDLRPSILEDLGLVAAIDWLANDFKAKHGVNNIVNARDLPIKLKDDAAIALFRIVQESLTNIAKHTNADLVNIKIAIKNQKLNLFISDNGQGLEEGWKSKKGSYGLQGMNERTIALGGKMKIRSELNKGVSILISLPIDENIIYQNQSDEYQP